jgi:hypothetical protein
MELFTGKEYLMMSIAGNFDGALEKSNWSKRLDWFKSNKTKLHSQVQNSENKSSYYAGYLAFSNYLKGKPSGHLISLDACSSVIQILACLSGCEKSARLCGVIDTGKREDAYLNFGTVMGALSPIIGSKTRKQLKNAIMTAFYASIREPKELLQNDEAYEVFMETLAVEAPGAWETNKKIQDARVASNSVNHWQLPDLYNAVIKVKNTEVVPFDWFGEKKYLTKHVNKPAKVDKSLSPNGVHSIDAYIVREMVRRANISPEEYNYFHSLAERKNKSFIRNKDKMLVSLNEMFKKTGMLSSRVFDYIDEDNAGILDNAAYIRLLGTIPKVQFSIVPVHDCFRIHPNFGNETRMLYNHMLSELTASRMLQHLLHCINPKYRNKNFVINRKMAKTILDANYALS